MKPLVRVLIVTDDWPNAVVNGGFLPWTTQDPTQATGRNSRQFHLGEFLSVLQNTVWVGFNVEITKAHRTPAGTTETEAQIKTDRGADVVNFRFNQPFVVNGQPRTLADYDMALLFAINAGNPDAAFAGEAESIAKFMENGGGFFATGDHDNLGAPLCGLIPRVRTMRRWWSGTRPPGAPEAPPAIGPLRHDTTQAGLDGVTNFEDQSDEVAQPISPARYDAGASMRQGYIARKYLPHPLLCSPQGPVMFLPDHMHEGTCEIPADLQGTFTAGGGAVREYPDYTPANAPAGYVPGPLLPEIVATGQVVLNTTSPALDAFHTGGLAPTSAMTFGVIGAWDGQRVAKGRVVVDSTWHHFFNINLTGDRYLENDSLGPQHAQKMHGFYVPDIAGGRVACEQYKMIQWYFRNIIYWLIPASRHRGILWNTLLDVIKRPRPTEELGGVEDFKALKLEHFLYFSQLAEEYLGQARGACASYQIKVILYKPKIPWWEWIQEMQDVWDPVEKQIDRKKFGDLRRDIVAGALGAGPQPEFMSKISLGAAVVSAAVARSQAAKAGEPGDIAEAAERLFTDVAAHSASLFAQELKAGMAASKRLLEVVSSGQQRR